MLDKLIEKAKTIFISEKEKQIIEETNFKHSQSAKIFFKDLDEISSKYYISEVYSVNEVYENNRIKYFNFKEADFSISSSLKKKYMENEGELILVDEETKKIINKNFRLTPNFQNIHFREKQDLTSAPDFIYEFENQCYWVVLELIRTSEKEEEHTKYLETLYRALYKASKIEIDAGFKYGSNEKWYDLIYFRLDRNSLFLVVGDMDNKHIYHSHEFKHIDHIRLSDLQDRYKFWLYMFEGNYRFFVPYTKEELYGEDVMIDPLIYKI